MAQPTEYTQVFDNSPSGGQFGKSATEKISFYGATPVVRPTLTGSVSSSACLSTIVAALDTLGLVTNSTTG